MFIVIIPALLIFLSNKKKKYQTGEREIFSEKKKIKCHCKPMEMCVAIHNHVALRVSLDFSTDVLGEA